MDKLDESLIAALRQNARASVTDLAYSLDVSRATIRTRIDKLQQSGKIVGFTVVLEGDEQDQPVRGMTLVEIEGKGNDAIIRRLSGYSEIQAIHTTNGRWDCVLEFATQTLEELDDFLKRLRLIDGISNSETSLFLATVRSSRARRPK